MSESINQSIFDFMSVHHRGDIRQKQKAKTYNYYLYKFSHRAMKNRFDNISNNIINIQNISYIVVSI